MALMYPERGEDAQSAAEGTAAHWAGSEILSGRLVDVGQVAPNGVVLNDEMIDAAELYSDDVFAVLVGRDPASNLHVEERVDIGTINPQCFGTPDCWYFDPVASTLYVWDFKFGHKFVDAFENWQLIAYAAGVLDSLGVDGLNDQQITVALRVVQPRSYHYSGPVREWRVIASDLRPYFNRLTHAAAVALMPNPVATVNPACDNCNGRHACQALQRAALGACDLAGSSLPIDLPTDALGLELRYMKRAQAALDARISGLEESVMDKLRQGERVPFFAVAMSSGRERWSASIPEVIALGEMLGVSLAKPTAITPKQAIKAGVPADVVSAYSETPAGSPKLIVDDGDRARKVFG
jgi:hypothetical protein